MGAPALPDTPEEPGSGYRHHDAMPGAAPDRSARTAVPDSFPASDPLATTAAVGARAVDPSGLMPPTGPETGDTAEVTARFPNQEAAKLALEGPVRDVPLDRRRTSLRSDEGGATLEVAAPMPDAERVRGMLRRCGGQLGEAARDPGDGIRGEIARLRAQVEQLARERVAPAATGAARAAGDYAGTAQARVVGETERAAALVRDRPLAALAVTAAVAFLLGRLSGDASDHRRR